MLMRLQMNVDRRCTGHCGSSWGSIPENYLKTDEYTLQSYGQYDPVGKSGDKESASSRYDGARTCCVDVTSRHEFPVVTAKGQCKCIVVIF